MENRQWTAMALYLVFTFFYFLIFILFYCSIFYFPLLYKNLRFLLAGEGNRTLVASLEGWSFTTKQHPHIIAIF